MDKPTSYLDTFNEGEAKCPYCGNIDDESWEISDSCYEFICGYCNKKSHLEIENKRLYTTLGDCKLNGEMPHVFFTRIIHSSLNIFKCKKCLQEFYDHDLPDGEYPKLEEGEFIFEEEVEE